MDVRTQRSERRGTDVERGLFSQPRPPAWVAGGLLAVFLVLALLPSVPFAQRRHARPITLGIVEDDRITEASGLVASHKNPDVLWLHNDSGDGPLLYAISSSGDSLGTVTLPDADATDWEDLAIGPGPEKNVNYLYVGDFGDNDAKRDSVTIYRVREPAAPEYTLTGPVDIFHLRYPDGPRDAEALIVDPRSGDLVIVSKRDPEARVYTAPADLAAGSTSELTFRGTLPVTNITAGDISSDGQHVLLKTYDFVLHWSIATEQTIPDGLISSSPDTLSYIPEPQGEALAFSLGNRGYYTISEERGGVAAAVSYYPFNPSTNKSAE